MEKDLFEARKSSRLKIQNYIISIFILCPFVFPAMISANHIGNTIYRYWLLFSSIIIYISSFVGRRRKRDKRTRSSLFFGLFIVFVVYYVCLTFVLHGDYKGLIQEFYYSVAFCLLFYLVFKKRNTDMLNGMVSYYELMLYLTLLLHIIFPAGVYFSKRGTGYTFFGNYNTLLRVFFPGLLLSIIYSYMRFQHLTRRVWLMLLSFTLLMFLVGSTTGLISMLVVVALLFLSRRRVNSACDFIASQSYICSLAFNFLVVFYTQIQPIQEFATSVLGKDSTFSGRTYYWTLILARIYLSPLVGYGYLGSDMRKIIIMGDYSNFSCHNFYLDITHRSGLIGLGILVIMIIVGTKFVCSSKNRMSISIGILYLALFISMIFEPFVDSEFRYFIAPLFIGVYCKRFGWLDFEQSERMK